jgi:hypothetical protein
LKVGPLGEAARKGKGGELQAFSLPAPIRIKMLPLPVSILQFNIHSETGANWMGSEARVTFNVEMLRKGLPLGWPNVTCSVLTTHTPRIVNFNDDAGISGSSHKSLLKQTCSFT